MEAFAITRVLLFLHLSIPPSLCVVLTFVLVLPLSFYHVASCQSHVPSSPLGVIPIAFTRFHLIISLSSLFSSIVLTFVFILPLSFYHVVSCQSHILADLSIIPRSLNITHP
jgi:hypothetical protein